MSDRDFREIESFGSLSGRLPKKVAVGVVSHRRLQVETPDQVAARIREALEHIDPSQLILSTDCGFGRQGCNRDVAFFKNAAIAQVRNIVLEELGVRPRPVPAADRAANRHRPQNH